MAKYDELTREDLIEALERMGEELARKSGAVMLDGEKIVELSGIVDTLKIDLQAATYELRRSRRLKAIAMRATHALGQAWLDTIDYLQEG